MDYLDKETTTLVIKRNLKDEDSMDIDKSVKKLASITHCRLDREHLKSVPILDFLPRLTNLYLQCNEIEEMSNFSILSGLRFLTLAENKIIQIRGIKDLPRLGFLDVSENVIEKVDYVEVPSSLVILNISDNPCCETTTFLEDIARHLPNLKSLDGQLINASPDVSSSESEESSNEDIENIDVPKDLPHDKKRTGGEDHFYDDLSTKMNDSLQNFLGVLSEQSQELQNDFTEFTTIPSPVNTETYSELSDKKISALEKDVASITILKPIEPSKKPIPRPPGISKSRVASRRRPVSGGTNTTKVRTPGARPFRRVVN